MATEKPLYIESFLAGEDLSAKQYYFVKLNSSGNVICCSGITDVAIGILQNKPESGEIASILMLGKSKLSADAAFSIGAVIAPSADGQGQTAVATQSPGARALEAATVAGQLVEVFVFPAFAIKA